MKSILGKQLDSSRLISHHISSHVQPLVMHVADNYNAQDCHRPSEAVVQSCLFMPLASLLRLIGMTDAGVRVLLVAISQLPMTSRGDHNKKIIK